jgi:hypothetical protein
MYIFGSIVLLIFAFLFIVSCKEKLPDKSGGVLSPFVKMAVFLYRKAAALHLPFFRSGNVDKALMELNPDKPISDLRLVYYAKKVGLMLGMVFMGIGLAALVKYQADQSVKLQKDNILYRKEFGENAETIRLQARIEGEFSQDMELLIPVRRLTKEEANTLAEEYWRTLQESIRNQSSEDGYVTEDILLETESLIYPFIVTWKSSNPDLLAKDGRIGTVSEATDVNLTATLTYLPPVEADIEGLPSSEGSVSDDIFEELVWSHQLTLHLNQPVRTKEETIGIKLAELLKNAMDNTQTKGTWQLPEELEGEQIIWTEKPEDFSLWILGMVLSTAVLIYFFSDRDLKGKVDKRRDRLRDEYPMIVNKLILYLGAGLTLRGAYQKIAGQYQEKKEQDHISHPAYEEIVITCHEIKAGVPESVAYENFGKRSGVSAYVKLNALLIQNLRKGSKTLLERLRKEGDLALIESLQRQRKVGEEAGTKLLIPMIMMLGVVMILVMIPAFSSFGT